MCILYTHTHDTGIYMCNTMILLSATSLLRDALVLLQVSLSEYYALVVVTI